MNDTMEFRIAIDIAKRQLEERIKDVNEADQRLYKWIINNVDHISHVNICSVSFCRKIC
jgi:hypothetical protein